MAQIATVRVPRLNKEINVPTGLFINNEFVPSVDSSELIHAVNPFTEEVICSVVSGIIDVAVAAARKAFNTTWGKNVTGFDRSRLIHRLADLIEQNAQELAELESLNNGKPVRMARDFDIGDTVQCLRYYAGWADKIAGQVAPALAVGCTIVMKPSELTPLTALSYFFFGNLICLYSFPPGVLNTVPSLGSVGGSALAVHPDVDKVAFTGSTITGPKSNLKKVSLELGGKSPHLIFESCDMDQAANWAALGICYNSGQDCTAGSRVYVQDSIHDKFVDLLVSKVKELVFGDGLDDKTSGGPVIFGPVLSVGRFKTERSNQFGYDTSYGLGAGLHSNDANQCMRVASALDAGTKQSVCSPRLGGSILDTSVKAVHWNFGEKLDWPI
ncbi:Aldehyde/histidinol dehydrogenase [Mycena sp. CBHHK59/15]|nr:Aldehyde/histidinol dehydrogenase [Mycena sp. CBHHK59/15]